MTSAAQFSVVFQDLPQPTRPRPLLSLYGIIIIIYMTWYASCLREAAAVRLLLFAVSQEGAWHGRWW